MKLKHLIAGMVQNESNITHSKAQPGEAYRYRPFSGFEKVLSNGKVRLYSFTPYDWERDDWEPIK